MTKRKYPCRESNSGCLSRRLLLYRLRFPKSSKLNHHWESENKNTYDFFRLQPLEGFLLDIRRKALQCQVKWTSICFVPLHTRRTHVLQEKRFLCIHYRPLHCAVCSVLCFRRQKVVSSSDQDSSCIFLVVRRRTLPNCEIHWPVRLLVHSLFRRRSVLVPNSVSGCSV
jgi:hypothetical protein